MFSNVIQWRNKQGSKKTPELVKAGRGQLVEATCGGAAASTYSHLEGRTMLSRGAASRAEAARRSREREGTEQSSVTDRQTTGSSVVRKHTALVKTTEEEWRYLCGKVSAETAA